MRTKPAQIAQALVDHVEADPSSVDQACAVALELLRKASPGFAKRNFLKLVEREMRRRGEQASGLLIVPNTRTVKSEHVGKLVSKSSGKQNVRIDERVEPNLIGAAALNRLDEGDPPGHAVVLEIHRKPCPWSYVRVKGLRPCRPWKAHELPSPFADKLLGGRRDNSTPPIK
jgi:hypothetical protein